ncbi:MAG: branched-chain amino acid ABC transporter permease [Microthrixaceae bacterium]
MTEFLNAVVNGIGLGSVYGLVAVGLVLLFKSTGLLNFAHGMLMTTGALMAAAMVSGGRSFWAAAAIAIAVTALLGGLIHLTVIRPLATRGLFAGVMVTIGLSEVMHGVLSIHYGPGQRLLPPPIKVSQVEIFGGARISTTLLLCLAVVLTAVGLLGLLFRYTLLGVQLRGASQSPQLAAGFGANLALIFTIAWVISAGLGATAGILLGTLSVIELTLGDFALRAFTALIVGGADSIPGALVGGIVVGLVELLSGTYLGSEYRLVATMGLLLAFLVIRPTGLFGSGRLRRV